MRCGSSLSRAQPVHAAITSPLQARFLQGGAMETNRSPQRLRLALAALLAAMATALSAQNLILNPHFDTGLQNWLQTLNDATWDGTMDADGSAGSGSELAFVDGSSVMVSPRRSASAFPSPSGPGITSAPRSSSPPGRPPPGRPFSCSSRTRRQIARAHRRPRLDRSCKRRRSESWAPGSTPPSPSTTRSLIQAR